MKINKVEKKIKIGKLILKKTADIKLLNNEFITFKDKNKEYDFSKKKLGLLYKPIYKL